MDFKKYTIILSLILCVLGSQIIWADTNGIWHLAQDVRPGVFGENEDDPTTPFSFENTVIYKSIELDDRFIVDSGDTVEGAINFLDISYNGTNLDDRYINALEDDYLNGDLVIGGTITAQQHLYQSDINLKQNITPLKNNLNKIKKINGVNFNWKNNDKKDIGFIAQDIELVFPELVVTNEKTGIKSVKYGNIVPILVEAIKEQQTQIEKLEFEVSKLKNEN